VFVFFVVQNSDTVPVKAAAQQNGASRKRKEGTFI
jgi:hypothetical protein